MSDGVTEPDPQHLLPDDLRARWAVVPRASLYGLFAAGVLLGAGAGLAAAGALGGDRRLGWAFPVALLLSLLVGELLRRRDRQRLRELAGRA